ncbi:ribokinase-like isoform X1 [Ciona intestinalis]
MDNSDIVVVGSCNMDLVTYTPRLPLKGESIHGHRYVTGFGGKGANQCVAATKLGAKTSMVARVGEDSHGEQYIENFKTLKVNTDHVIKTKNETTGVAPITVADDGSNCLVIVPGANMILSSDDVEQAYTCIKNCKVLLCQLEVQPSTSLHALKLAKSLGITTIFTPAPAPVTKLDEKFFEYADVICPNETEAEALTGISVTDTESGKKAAEVLVKKGCQIGIVTLGQNGCVFAEKSTNKVVHVPAPAVKPVDTTGAGDAFTGALAFYLARFPELSTEEKLQRSCQVASFSVCRNGTQTSYPFHHELPEKLFSA